MKIRTILCASALLASVSLSHAQVTLDFFNGAKAAANAGPLTWSQTIGVGSDTALMVAITFEDGAAPSVGNTPSGVTFGSQNLTQLLLNTEAASLAGPTFNVNQVSIWYLMNPTVGTANITVNGLTLGNAGNNVCASSASFFGVGSIFASADYTTPASIPTLTFNSVPTGSAAFAGVCYSSAATTATSSTLTIPTGGMFTGGQAGHGAGYALGLSGTATVSFNQNNARDPMSAVILAPVAVPEPTTMALAFLGLGGLALLRKRK